MGAMIPQRRVCVSKKSKETNSLKNTLVSMGLSRIFASAAFPPQESAPQDCVWQSVKCHLSNALCVTVCRSSHHAFSDPCSRSKCHKHAGEFVKISWKRKDGNGLYPAPEGGLSFLLIYESISLTAWPCINIIIKQKCRQGTVYSPARTSQSSLANRAFCVYCVFALWSIQFSASSQTRLSRHPTQCMQHCCTHNRVQKKNTIYLVIELSGSDSSKNNVWPYICNNLK